MKNQILVKKVEHLHLVNKIIHKQISKKKIKRVDEKLITLKIDLINEIKKLKKTTH